MEDQKFPKNSTEHINASLRGYAEYFSNLYLRLKWNGIGDIRSIFKDGGKLETAEEYFKKFNKTGETFSKEQLENPGFILRVKKLDELAERLNSLGENITEEEIKDAKDKAKEFVRS